MLKNLKIFLFIFVSLNAFADKWNPDAETPFAMLGFANYYMSRGSCLRAYKRIKQNLERKDDKEGLELLKVVKEVLESDTLRAAILIPTLEAYTKSGGILQNGQGRFFAEMVQGYAQYELDHVGRMVMTENLTDAQRQGYFIEYLGSRYNNFLSERQGFSKILRQQFAKYIAESKGKKPDGALQRILNYPNTIRFALGAFIVGTCLTTLIRGCSWDGRSTDQRLSDFQNAPAEVAPKRIDPDKAAEQLGERLPD